MVIEHILNERQLKDPVTTVIQDEILIAELSDFIASKYTTSWHNITSNDLKQFISLKKHRHRHSNSLNKDN